MSRPPLALILAAPDTGPDPLESVRAFLPELGPHDRLLVVKKGSGAVSRPGSSRAHLKTETASEPSRRLPPFPPETPPVGRPSPIFPNSGAESRHEVGPLSADPTHPDPRVTFLTLPPRTLVPDLWRAGLDASTEPLVAFSSAGMVPEPGWLSSLVSTLEHTSASAVGGPIAPECSRLSATDRAVYLHRYARYWPPVDDANPIEPPGENALYLREHLLGLPPLNHPGFWEVEIHRALRAGGHHVAFAPSAVVRYTGGARFSRLLRTRARHALRFGAFRTEGQGGLARCRALARTPLVPALLLARPLRAIHQHRQPWRSWLPALPALASLTVTWALGEAVGTIFGNHQQRSVDTESRGPIMNAPESKNGMGILVVGVGWLGSRRARAALAAHGTRLAAVFDDDETRAQREAHRLGVLAVPDLSSGLRLPGVDAVVIATPPGDHARIIKKSLEANKHVLCEKPLTIDPYQARVLAQLADDRRLRLATGLDHRFWPPVAEALALVKAGRIGLVESVRAQIGHRASGEFLASWHIDPQFSGGGCLIDNGPHACDLIRQFSGEVVAAKGYVGHPLELPDGCESEAFALFRGQDRAHADLHVSWTLPVGYLTLEILGRDGFLRVETAPWKLTGLLGGGRRIHRLFIVERAKELIFQKLHGCGSSLVRELEAFANARHPHPRPGATGWDGCRATEMIQAVYRSSETGEEVFLDPLPVRLPELTRSRAAREAL